MYAYGKSQCTFAWPLYKFTMVPSDRNQYTKKISRNGSPEKDIGRKVLVICLFDFVCVLFALGMLDYHFIVVSLEIESKTKFRRKSCTLMKCRARDTQARETFIIGKLVGELHFSVEMQN